MFYVKLFKNTGYNLVNVPDSIETLMSLYQAADFVVADIDILQIYHNDTISIRVPHGESDIIDADFLLLADSAGFNGRVAAYVISGYEMTSGDAVDLYVDMEPFLTAGGINNIEFLDGTTTRHHVSPDRDTWGTYVEEDPLLVPSHAPTMSFIGGYFSSKENGAILPAGYMLVEMVNELGGNFNINKMVDLAIDNDGSFMTALTTNQYNGVQISGWRSSPPKIGVCEDYQAGTIDSGGFLPNQANTVGSLTMYAIASTYEQATGNAMRMQDFIDSIKWMFEWGMTGIIKNAYFIPQFWRDMLDFTIKSGADRGVIESINAKPWHKETGYLSPAIHEDPDILTDKNVRAYYGSNRQIIAVATGTGETIAKNPEMVYPVASVDAEHYMDSKSGIAKANNSQIPNAKIDVFGWADPRVGGCPKFHILGIDDPQLEPEDIAPISGHGFCFKDYIKGQPWGAIPIGLNATVGAGQAAVQYSSQKALSDWQTIFSGNSDVYQNSGLNPDSYGIGGFMGIGFAKSRIGDFFSNMKSSAARGYEENKFAGSTLPTFGASSMEQMNDWGKGNLYGSKRSQAYAQREQQARAEALQYVVSQVPQPILACSASDTVDPSGNGLLLFRMVPDGRDVAKYEKILNQYGYRITEPIQADFMKNRPLYNYIQATGVSCKANGVPKSVRDDLAVAFTQGLRIWHVKPDPNEYNTDNNKTTPMP